MPPTDSVEIVSLKNFLVMDPWHGPAYIALDDDRTGDATSTTDSDDDDACVLRSPVCPFILVFHRPVATIAPPLPLPVASRWSLTPAWTSDVLNTTALLRSMTTDLAGRS